MSLTLEQVAERTGYIGGSDCAAVLGMSRWRTPIQVWAEKAKLVEPEDISEKLSVWLGIRMEEIVAERFEKETGKKVHKVNEARFHPKHSFIGANIDRRVVGENAILELKTTSAWKKKEWDDEEIPHEYLLQVQHYLLVTGAKYAYIGVLIGNESFVWQKIERDEELIATIEKRMVEFWNDYVLPKVMPKIVQAADTDFLNRLYPHQIPGSEVHLPDEARRIVESRQALLQDKAAISKQIDQADAEIKAFMGEHETGRVGNYRVTWKAFHRKSYTVAESDGRTLRITEENSNGNH